MGPDGKWLCQHRDAASATPSGTSRASPGRLSVQDPKPDGGPKTYHQNVLVACARSSHDSVSGFTAHSPQENSYSESDATISLPGLSERPTPLDTADLSAVAFVADHRSNIGGPVAPSHHVAAGSGLSHSQSTDLTAFATMQDGRIFQSDSRLAMSGDNIVSLNPEIVPSVAFAKDSSRPDSPANSGHVCAFSAVRGENPPDEPGMRHDGSCVGCVGNVECGSTNNVAVASAFGNALGGSTSVNQIPAPDVFTTHQAPFYNRETSVPPDPAPNKHFENRHFVELGARRPQAADNNLDRQAHGGAPTHSAFEDIVVELPDGSGIIDDPVARAESRSDLDNTDEMQDGSDITSNGVDSRSASNSNVVRVATDSGRAHAAVSAALPLGEVLTADGSRLARSPTLGAKVASSNSMQHGITADATASNKGSCDRGSVLGLESAAKKDVRLTSNTSCSDETVAVEAFNQQCCSVKRAERFAEIRECLKQGCTIPDYPRVDVLQDEIMNSRIPVGEDFAGRSIATDVANKHPGIMDIVHLSESGFFQREILQQRHPDLVPISDYRLASQAAMRRCSIVASYPPCQSYSAYGKREGIDDPLGRGFGLVCCCDVILGMPQDMQPDVWVEIS